MTRSDWLSRFLLAGISTAALVGACGGRSVHPGADAGAADGDDAAAVPNDAEADADDAGASSDAAAPKSDAADAGNTGSDPDSDPDDAAPAPACPEVPPVRRAAGAIVTFQTEPFLAGQALVFGEANALPGGGTLTPLDLRYYISDVALEQSNGRLTPVDLVSAEGTPEPFGVHFFNAEDAPSTAWSVRAPAGNYQGVTWTLGLVDACNVFDPSRAAPLNAESQMTWPPPFNYLFLRFEANVAGASVDRSGHPWVSAIAMGGLAGSLFAPVVRIDGPLPVPASGSVTHHLRLDMEQLFNGANAEADMNTALVSLPGPGGVVDSSEGAAGERLRQSASKLPIFVLDP